MSRRGQMAFDFAGSRSARGAGTRPHARPRTVRQTDPATSREAAKAVERKLTELHEQVLAAFERPGAMSARQAERLQEFAELGPSTVRKRISELARMGRLAETGEVEKTSGRRGCAVYRLATGAPDA